jgi:acyl-coenzyme A thioesterase PaaI-like protein
MTTKHVQVPVLVETVPRAVAPVKATTEKHARCAAAATVQNPRVLCTDFSRPDSARESCGWRGALQALSSCRVIRVKVRGFAGVDGMVAQAIRLAPVQGSFGLRAAGRLMLDVVAPWIQDLGLLIEVIEVVRPAGANADWQPRAVLRLPYSQKSCRMQEAVGAPALMASADTAIMLVCAAAWNGYRPMRAMDHTMQFLRPAKCDVLAEARIVGTGPTTIFARATLSCVADEQPLGMVTGTYTIV